MNGFKQQYRIIKHQIITMHNPKKGIAAFFCNPSIRDKEKYAIALCNEHFFRNVISGLFFPNSVSGIDSCGNMPLFLDLSQTLLWYTLALRIGAAKISDFLALREEYDTAYLNSDFEACKRILDTYHTQFGWSMWEIEKRISVLNLQAGVEGQKQYVENIINQFAIGSIPYYILSCYSKQCEQGISIGTYSNILESDYKRFMSNGTPEALCIYAKYKARGYLFGEAQAPANILTAQTVNYFLFSDDKYSLIDRYLSFCDIVDDIIRTNQEEICAYFFPYLAELAKKISDPFLQNAADILEKQYFVFRTENNDKICQIYDYYTTGCYKECFDSAKIMLQKSSKFFPIVEIYSKCSVFLPDFSALSEHHSVLNTIIQKLALLFKREGDIQKTQNELIKTLYTNLESPWARELLFIIDKYNKRLVSLEDVDAINLHSSISTPDMVFAIPHNYLAAYLRDCPDAYTRSLSTQLAIAVRTADNSLLQRLPIDSIRKDKYVAICLLNKDPAQALSLLKSIEVPSHYLAVQYEVDALQIRAYLEQDKILNAMEIFVPAFFSNKNFIYIGSIDRIFDAIKSANYELQSSILTPIMCEIYFNYYPYRDDKDDVIWNICYEEYLDAREVEKPSDLLSQTSLNDIYVTYFLARVCVPNVMDRSLSFSSYDEVLQERILICEELIKRNPDSADEYSNEIHRLTHSLLIRLAKRKVENSKIYVDVEGMRALFIKEIADSYERYIQFRKNDLDDRVIAILGENRVDAKVLGFNGEKQRSMLEDIIKRMRNTFVADNKYGLDGCLSVRIRHGTLESQLRSCFEKHKLITTKGPDGLYKGNTSWNQTVYKEIDEIFANFSLSIDKIIDNIKKSLIQIKTEDKNEKGLFDFSIDANFVRYIESRIPVIYEDEKVQELTTFDEFKEFMIQIFLNMTENYLEAVRKVLEHQINRDFQNALISLETELEKYKKIIKDYHGLSNQIANARTDISTELKSISEWFRLAQLDAFEDYPLSLAATISSDIMKYAHSSQKLHIDTSQIDEGIRLKGRTLPNFVDIFKILIDNVIKHSGDIDPLSAHIYAKQEPNEIILTMDNRVEHGSIDETSLTIVEASLNNWESQGYTNREGGSGLYKIKKILTIDLNCKNSISFNLQNDVFSVQIRASLGDAML